MRQEPVDRTQTHLAASTSWLVSSARRAGAPILDTTTAVFDTTRTRRFVTQPKPGVAAKQSISLFFDFVQNLTDFMQAVGRVQRLASPVLRR
jgi:hypothetical protein